ncbi:hypothetical protein PC120_g11090 [Phytophthora cactorum]|nr:hypothetical protein PC120_g11090 [Phytophthora cactorum]
MLVWREYHHVEGSLLDRILERCVSNKAQSDNWSKLDFVPRIYRLIWELYLFLKELTGFQGKHRKLWNLCLKALDLTMQYFMLSGLLEAGTPVELIFGFAVFTALNSLFCAIEIINHRFTAFAEILIDSLFDLCAAVLFPIVVLVYSANNFDFDRAVFHINMELLPVGSFERRAQMFASPTEIELFRVSFDSLRIRTVADYFLRIGMNLGFSYRFKRVVELRGCHNLNYISLINCAVEELPIWAKGFRKLQYLQIEGKVGSDNLGNLADDLFSDMPELRYLQLGLHQRMAENDTETCSGVAVVDATSLSSLGVQAAELTNTTLTELNLTDNNIADVRDLQLPETLQQLYLSRNKLTSLEIPESWRHLEVLNVSDNPIANFTAEGKDGPRVLIARNTSLSSMEDVVFPATLRQLDVSLTPIANWGNFTPPTDLSDLTAQDSSIELLGPANFSACDRSFTMDFSGNNITTIRGVRFPPNLRTLFLNGSSVTQFEVCKSDVKVLERLEAFDVTTLTLADDSCSDATIPTSVIIANTSYSLCVLTDAAFDGKYKGGKVSSSTSLTTLLLLLFSIASAVLVLLMLFAIKRKIIDERRAKAARAEKLKAEHAASEGSSDDEESDKMKMSSAMLTDDVRSDPDFERYRIPQNDLEVVKQLAKGAGGVVHLAKWKPKNEQVVVKRVAPEKSKSVRELQRFTREIRLYGSLKHPKIVAFRGIAWSSLADLSLVLEYMPNGDLAQFLERQQMLDSQRRGWSWLTDEDSGFKHSKLTMALDVADALVYLHSFAEPIMHRDLKAQNILLSNKWVAKISDFGVSKRREQRNEQQGVSSGGPQTAEVGTAAWIAPEVIKGARYDQKADIYSFGVVMCELDTCTRPYALGVASSHSASGMTSFTSASQASDDEEVKSLLSSNATLALAVSEKGVMPAFHSDCPRAILDLARMCLSYDPEDRPTAKELWRLLQDLAAPGALLTSSRKATLTESLRHVSTSA